ncbi:MAG TPA: prenyltransferase/squalene oxidase repeat-containing protein [Planctomycetota bacterium]|jgi:hypothetical protein|nr:prenyltransferase/squalene oxidase repeat-containing protein [Planctomycetota bacterium]
MRRGSARERFLLAAAVLAAGAAATRSAAQQPARKVSPQILREEITTELRLAVARGISYLEKRQEENGDFDREFPVAVNALAGIALLAGGSSERAGAEHFQMLRRATTAILRHQNGQGYFDDGKSLMYGHGFATLYLAELYGTSDHRIEQIRTALYSAVKVIEGSQGSAGGWDYSPGPKFGGAVGPSGGSDTSITVCQTMALRSAKGLGILTSGDVVRRATAYIEQAQNADGGFRYREHGLGPYLGSSSAFPRSAAGVCILTSLGEYSTPHVAKGFEYLRKEYRFPWSNQFPYYAHYYCAQAMFQAGGRDWKAYFPWIRAELVKNQQTDGSWSGSSRENDVQATAMALIILQLPYRFLPIHER